MASADSHPQVSLTPREAISGGNRTRSKERKTGKKSTALVTTLAITAVGAVAGGAWGLSRVFGDGRAVDHPTSQSGEQLQSDVTEDELALLQQRPSEAQIQYVLDHPVTAEEFPDLNDQATAIGNRLNLAILSCEPNFDSDTELTPESQALLDKLVPTFVDPESPAYNTVMDAITVRGRQVGAMFFLDPSAETHVVMSLNTEVPVETTEDGVSTSVYLIWDSNQPDTTSADGRYNNDWVVPMTFSQNPGESVRLTYVGPSKDIGNIG